MVTGYSCQQKNSWRLPTIVIRHFDRFVISHCLFIPFSVVFKTKCRSCSQKYPQKTRWHLTINTHHLSWPPQSITTENQPHHPPTTPPKQKNNKRQQAALVFLLSSTFNHTHAHLPSWGPRSVPPSISQRSPQSQSCKSDPQRSPCSYSTRMDSPPPVTTITRDTTRQRRRRRHCCCCRRRSFVFHRRCAEGKTWRDWSRATHFPRRSLIGVFCCGRAASRGTTWKLVSFARVGISCQTPY